MIPHRNKRASSCFCPWLVSILASMKIWMSLLLLIFPILSLADVQYAAGGGVLANENNNNADSKNSVREEASFSWYAGSRILYSAKDAWAVRTGLGFQDKSALYSYKNSTGSGDTRLSSVSLSFPLQVQWQQKHVSPFAGYSADFSLNDDCEADGNSNECSLYGDVKSMIHHAVIGASVHLQERWDMDVSYQRALTDSYTDVKIHSLILQIFYKF
jgi:hypothetical protein